LNQLISTDKQIAVVGLGLTGLSYARYLQQQCLKFVLMDTREQPPMLEQFEQEFKGSEYLQALHLGGLDLESLLAADKILLSPGFPLDNELLQTAKNAGVPIQGDIALFVESIDSPVVAITGSNAKSTVVSLLGLMAEIDGRDVAVAGNIGQPVLELLQQDKKDLYILELSSFQLEAVENLNVDVACILNVSEDHLDRYQGMPHYHATKQKIYFGAKHIVCNRLDPLTQPPLAEGVQLSSFGLNTPDFKQFGLRQSNGDDYLAYQFENLMPASEMSMAGRHNIENALAALAIGKAAGLGFDAMLQGLREYKGLPHRCQLVAEVGGVKYVNDSKATNVGAALAALNGFDRGQKNIILIAGGVGKGADFSPLKTASGTIKSALLIGEDAQALADALVGVDSILVDTLAAAVKLAASKACAGDLVLLSPACASLDMFKNFEARGDAFSQAVSELADGGGIDA